MENSLESGSDFSNIDIVERPYRKTGKNLVCPTCQKDFYLPKCLIEQGRRFCSNKCKYQGLKGIALNTGRTHFQKGMIPWNKNKTGYMGSNKTSFKKGNVPWNYGKPNPSAQKERHPRWKGGITPLRNRLWQCHKHTVWRNSIFERDNYTCQMCDTKGGYLEADHYPTPFYLIRERYKITTYEDALECEELWDIKNGRTLCRECHKSETKKLRPYG